MQFCKLSFSLIILILLGSCDMVMPGLKARALNDKGLGYSEKGDKAEAIKYFREASNVAGISDSERTMYLENVGEEYFNINPDSAKYYYLKAGELNNRNSYRGLYEKANIDVLEGKVDKGLAKLLRAYEIDSINMQANNLAGLIYLGDFGKRYYNPARALKFNLAAYNISQSVTTTAVLARNYYLLNNMQEAIPLFEQTSKQVPGNAGYLETLIMVYLEAGRTEEANKLMEKLSLMDMPLYNRVINSNIKPGQHTLTWN